MVQVNEFINEKKKCFGTLSHNNLIDPVMINKRQSLPFVEYLCNHIIYFINEKNFSPFNLLLKNKNTKIYFTIRPC